MGIVLLSIRCSSEGSEFISVARSTTMYCTGQLSMVLVSRYPLDTTNRFKFYGAYSSDTLYAFNVVQQE